MDPFRWPDTRLDIALAIEVASSNPVKPPTRLRNHYRKTKHCIFYTFATRLLEKFKVECAKTLKRFNLFNGYHFNPIFNTHNVNILYILVKCLAILHLNQARRGNIEN